MWLFNIFYISCDAEAPAQHISCPLSWIVPGSEDGFPCTGMPCCPKSRDVRGVAAVASSIENPGLQTVARCLRPMAHRAWLPAPNVGERKWERKLTSKHISQPCLSPDGEIGRLAWTVPVKPHTGMHCIGLLWSGCYSEWNSLCWPGSRGDLLSLMGGKDPSEDWTTIGQRRRPVRKLHLSGELFSIKSLSISVMLWQCHLRRTFPFSGLRSVNFMSHHALILSTAALAQRKEEKLALTTVKILTAALGVRFGVMVRLSSASLSPSPSMMRSSLPIPAWISLRGWVCPLPGQKTFVTDSSH